MANDLTGDFDVVAEFSVAAVNRVLAAMHRGNRFPHSLSVRVDDTPHSRGSLPVVDLSGSAFTDRVMVGRTAPGTPPSRNALPSSSAVSRLLTQVLDPLVNSSGNGPDGGFSLLKGVAQLQLAAPRITLPSNAMASATVHIPAMVRYFPDPNTTALPEFLHGDIQTTFAAKEVSSQAGTFIHVDLAGPGGNIHFQQSPPQNLSALQLNSINAALRNALVTGF